MLNVLLVGVGGFIGAISRFGLSHFIIRQFVSHTFPIATLAINFFGSVATGLIFEYFKNHHFLPTITLFLVVGFLGSFTTFSAFSFETIELLKKNEFHIAAMNIIASVVLCLAGVVIGDGIGRYLK